LPQIVALPAYWVGLLYDQSALDAAWDLVKGWTTTERDMLREMVPRLGLETPFRTGTVQDIARETLKIARAGLASRDRRGNDGRDETAALEPLEDVVSSGRSLSDRMLAQYHGAWGGNIDRIFNEHQLR
jgi:glutamate--cysteine ligase